MQLVTEET